MASYRDGHVLSTLHRQTVVACNTVNRPGRAFSCSPVCRQRIGAFGQFKILYRLSGLSAPASPTSGGYQGCACISQSLHLFARPSLAADSLTEHTHKTSSRVSCRGLRMPHL